MFNSAGYGREAQIIKLAWERIPAMRPTLSYASIAAILFAAPWAQAERPDNSNESAIDDPRVQHRTYTFSDGEEIPYALFVPSTYDATTPHPVIVSLHGLRRQYDWLMGYHGLLEFAERDSAIVVTPLGYVRDGWFGSRAHEHAEKSEQDVMNVLQLVRDEFSVDPNRIYLWGHSMGGAGTYHLAAKYPEIWAGLGVAAPAPLASMDALETFAHIPIIALCGDEDRLVAPMRRWVARMGELGMQHVYIEIPGGDHSLFISQSRETLDKVFRFFSIVQKQPTSPE